MTWITLSLHAISILVLLVFFFTRRSGTSHASDSGLRDVLSTLAQTATRAEQAHRSGVTELRMEIISSLQLVRDEQSRSSRELREELVGTLSNLGSQILATLNEFRRENHNTSTGFCRQIVGQIESFSGALDKFRNDQALQDRELRETLNSKFFVLQSETLDKLQTTQTQLAQQGSHLKDALSTTLTRLGSELRENTIQFTTEVKGRLTDVSKQVILLSDSNEKKQEALRATVEQRLDNLTKNNSEKLEEMRMTVDEKLHTTLEKRLTESFGVVTDQLGKVHLGLGEMKDLAVGVGDLKRVLTNVKVRGGFAEVQLGMQLEQMLAPDQYIVNAQIKQNSQEIVEYAIRLPHGGDSELLLPIDAKFPREDWERLQDAQQRGQTDEIESAGRSFETGIRAEAKKISDKYIYPPVTTNFAIMFLPTEGLFAEVIRRPGLIDDLQTRCRVCVCGPTTFMALLTSLQMGFRTLAIQNKGTEVWNVLAAAKVDFEKFGGLMSKVERQVQTVQNTLGDINSKTKTINRKLKTVDSLQMSASSSAALLGLTEAADDGQDYCSEVA